MRLHYLAAALLIAAAAAQTDAVSDAVAALERGDLSSAEQTLRTALKLHPDDAAALDVLGVVLDQEKKFADADEAYGRATALDPHSPVLLNNYGNHLIATGKLKEARGVFLKVLALNPAQTNAAVQLARIALEQKAPAEALRYLERISPDARQSTDVAVLLGTALAGTGQYDKAEAVFGRAQKAAPDDFEILYKLGLAASHAGHNERALDVLQSARREQPQNVDVLYDLAAVNASLNHPEEALRLLAEAARLAPRRPEVQRLLARTTAELGYLSDSIQAWDRYLQLVPTDDSARRERAFAQTGLGENMQAAVAELKAWVERHPSDAVGHYELGVAESAGDADRALAQFDRAAALKPDLTAAHLARGLLNFRQGKPAAALPDFLFAARREPDNATVLDRLGQTYMALDRPGDAAPILRKASQLAPNDSKTLLHLGRALTGTGQEEEAKQVFARFRELGPDRSTLTHPAGLVDFLSLSPEEQMARYRAGIERTVRENPSNAEAQVHYLELLLGGGRTTEASAACRRILDLKPGGRLLNEAGGALLAAGRYQMAKEFLEPAISLAGPADELDLDLAIAVAHTAGPQAGLEQMDRIPAAERSGDYYLARAEMLGARGRFEDAGTAVSEALRATPRRPYLYRRAAIMLIRDHHAPDALPLLERAVRTMPDNPEMLLLKAAALDLTGSMKEAERLLKSMETRWPESPEVRAMEGHIALEQRDYAAAMARLREATQLDPLCIQAHADLAKAYSALGRTKDSQAELARAAELRRDGGDGRASIADLLSQPQAGAIPVE